MKSKDIDTYIAEGVDARKNIDLNLLFEIARVIEATLSKGGKIILFGNGGSASQAEHIAGEFVGKFKKERKAWPAIALNSNSSIVTAIANDYSYDYVFERQIEGYAKDCDIAIGITTSGNSESVIRALSKAKKIGCITVALTGGSGGKLNGMRGTLDYLVKVKSESTPIIQEVHITIGHLLAAIVEDSMMVK